MPEMKVCRDDHLNLGEQQSAIDNLHYKKIQYCKVQAKLRMCTPTYSSMDIRNALQHHFHGRKELQPSSPLQSYNCSVHITCLLTRG